LNFLIIRIFHQCAFAPIYLAFWLLTIDLACKSKQAHSEVINTCNKKT